MSKFTLILGTPPALPGCCFLTGSAQEEFYIDTGLQNDLNMGAVYIGGSSLIEMARLAGMVFPEELKSQEVLGAVLADEVGLDFSADNSAKLDTLEGKLNAILNLLSRFTSPLHYLPSASGQYSQQEERPALSVIEGADKSAQHPSNKSDESSNDSQLGGVRTATKRRLGKLDIDEL